VGTLARIFIDVYGCSANMADWEMAAGLLREAGHSIVPDPEGADASVVLTCTVKTPTENKVVKRIRELSEGEGVLVVAGCMPKAQRGLVAEVVPDASMVGPDDLLSIVDVVESALAGVRVEAVDGGPMDRSCLPRVRRNPVIHIAPIASGCLGDCSYCIVKHARGRLHSFPAEMIGEDARRAIEGGCREIWVTAEDTASYRDGDVRLPELLDSITGLDGRFYVRVGMMTPNQAEPIVDDLIESYRSDKVFKFLHVPVQSGNDEVLRRMNRRYTASDFRGLVAGFREAIPDVSLSTDIICGFPGETEEQFADSLRLVQEIQPDALNISRFWPRPGTEAAELNGQLHGRETKGRSRELSSLWRSLLAEKNRGWVGWVGEAVIDEEGKDETMVGRNLAYKPIVVKAPVKLGEIITVRITEAKGSYLLGETVS
jgi:threonylcarbamoyladenosine tRNA methylthiotransferase CDKAL1